MAVVSMKQLLESGAHFGHTTRKWNPKMKPYIYGSRSGIHIVDLRQTLSKLKEAYEYVYNLSANGNKILFVGTKSQARPIIAESAKKSNNFYVNERWLGGMLTNFNTIRQSISKMRHIEDLAGEDFKYTGIIKKEAVKLEKKRKKMELFFGGIKDMRKMPAALFVVDIRKESIAIQEANNLGIPVIAVMDTNCNPRGITFAIPGNDDAVRAIELYCEVIATAAVEGREYYDIQSKEKKEIAAKDAEESKKKLPAKKVKVEAPETPPQAEANVESELKEDEPVAAEAAPSEETEAEEAPVSEENVEAETTEKATDEPADNAE